VADWLAHWQIANRRRCARSIWRAAKAAPTTNAEGATIQTAGSGASANQYSSLLADRESGESVDRACAIFQPEALRLPAIRPHWQLSKPVQLSQVIAATEAVRV